MSSQETCISSCAMQINGPQQGGRTGTRPVRKSLYSLCLNPQHSPKRASSLILCVSHASASWVKLPCSKKTKRACSQFYHDMSQKGERSLLCEMHSSAPRHSGSQNNSAYTDRSSQRQCNTRFSQQHASQMDV